jgi:hypothetical protein
VAALWLATHQWGIRGAAAVWAGRMLLDVWLLLWAVARRVPAAAAVARQWRVEVLWPAACLALMAVPTRWPQRVALLLLGLGLLARRLPWLIGAGPAAPWRRLVAKVGASGSGLRG